MKSTIIILLSFFFSYSMFSQHKDEIIGTYKLPNELEVEVFKNGQKYSGRITSVKGFNNGQTTDYKNPDKSQRKDLLKGKTIINDLEYDKTKNHWINGKMYGPSKGLVFNLEVTEILQSEIEVVGSKFFFWKTMKWIRVDKQ